MARHRRIFVEGASFHVFQRGNNRCRVFDDDEDRERFLWYLKSASDRFETAIHGFVLMSTHYHLIASPATKESLPMTVKQFGGEYVQYYNRRHERVGGLWSGRYKSVLIRDERQLLTCMRYIDRNPVAANLVESPEAYPWSSFRAHAYGITERWLVDHPTYRALGPDPSVRQAAYRALCDEMSGV
jgi:putative transposase